MPIISAVRSVVITSDANLLMGVIISVWRNSCSPPMRYCFSGELPPISSIGTFGAKRVGHAGHRVGGAGTRGHHRAAQSRDARIGIGRVRRDLLMAHVHDLDAFVDAAVIDIDDVAAGNGEDVLDAFLLEHLGDDLAARNLGDCAGLCLGGVSSCGFHKTPVWCAKSRRESTIVIHV